MDTYCESSECEEPTDGHGPLCAMHAKRKQRGKSLSAAKQEKVTPMERAILLAGDLSECATDDDREYNRIRRALSSALKVLSREEQRAALTEARARAKARGVVFGRPRKLSCEDAARYLQTEGSIVRAARAAGVSRNTLKRTLRTCGAKYRIVDQHSGPRSG